ncbi:MAG: hypothetical protein DRG78_02985 [Epsilonproteobacteria bacterium]|nr:MAG: hypothetical protein DRG78_02985 [Campylobacterota bacterium]
MNTLVFISVCDSPPPALTPSQDIIKPSPIVGITVCKSFGYFVSSSQVLLGNSYFGLFDMISLLYAFPTESWERVNGLI